MARAAWMVGMVSDDYGMEVVQWRGEGRVRSEREG